MKRNSAKASIPVGKRGESLAPKGPRLVLESKRDHWFRSHSLPRELTPEPVKLPIAKASKKPG